MEIPKIQLLTVPETDEAKKAIGYKWNNFVGKRHFLGGKPNGIEQCDYPECEECNKKMTFYAQIDSIGDAFDLADCMVIHNFVCFDCFSVKAILNQI